MPLKLREELTQGRPAEEQELDLSGVDEELDLSGLDELDLDTEADTPGKLESFGRGAAQGATLGTVDEGVGAAKGMWDDMKSLFTGKDANNGVKPELDKFGNVTNGDKLTGNYEKYRDDYRADDKSAKDANGKMFLAGEMAGGVASSLLPGGAALNAAKGAKIGTVAAKGATQGALAGFGGSESETVGGNVLDAGKGAAMGAGFGAAGSKAGDVMRWVAEKMAKGGAKIALTASAPVEKYIANPAKYNGSESVENVAESLRPTLKAREKSVESASALAQRAAENAKDARAIRHQSLKDTRVPVQAEDALSDALKTQRSKVSGLAGEQNKLLAEAEGSVDISSILKGLKGRLEGREIEGIVPDIDPEAQDIQKMARLLEQVRDRKLTKGEEYSSDLLEELQTEGMQVSPKSAVNLRKTLDNFAAPAWTAPGVKYTPPGAMAAKEARSGINKLLDDAGTGLPGYKEVRGKLAKETGLAEEAGDVLGNPDRAKTLARMGDQGKDFDALKRLDANTGKKVLPEIREYLAAKGKMKDPARLDKYLDNSSQQVAADEAAKKARLLKASQEKLNGITSENVDKSLRTAMFAGPNKPELRNQRGLDELARRSGKDLNELVDILKVRGAFGKEGANGSRMVNLLTNLAPAPLKGPAAITAAAVDVGRGKTAKALLDGFLKAESGIKKTGDVMGKGVSAAAVPAAINSQQDQDGDAQFRALLELLGGKTK